MIRWFSFQGFLVGELVNSIILYQLKNNTFHPEEQFLKIVIYTKRDLAGCLALNRLMAGLSPKHDLFVVLSDFVLKAERANEYASRFVSYERDMVLDHLFPLLDSWFPEGGDAPFLTYGGLSTRYDVPIELWGHVRTPEVLSKTQALAPDLIISCRYDYIIQDAILNIPPLGTYGLHPGALPALQGLCSPFRAMQLGHDRSGCTLFHLDAGVDTGPIIEIGWTDIAYDRSVLWNFVHTYFAGIEVLLGHLSELEAGNCLVAAQQDNTEQEYYSYPTGEEFQRFINGGGSLVRPEDYLEMLSWFLPGGRQDEHMPELTQLVNDLSD